MAKYALIFLFSLLSICLKSQSTENLISIEDAAYDTYILNSKVTIRGHFVNFKPEELSGINIKYNVVVPLRKFENRETVINKDGSFECVVYQTHPLQQIWFEVGDYFYGALYVRTDLTIELDLAQLRKARVWASGEGVRFGGSDGALNEFMGKYNLKQNNFNEPLNAEKEALLSAKQKLSSSEFIRKFDTIMAQYKAADDAFVQANPSVFAWIIENERMSYYYHSVCSYHWGRKMDNALWEKVKSHKSYVMSNDACRYYSYLHKYVNYLASVEPSIDFGSPADWRRVAEIPDLNPTKRALVTKIVENPTNISDAMFKVFEKEMDFVLFEKTVFFTTALFDTLFTKPKADLLKFHLQSKNPNEQKVIMDLLLKNITTEWCKNALYSDYVSKIQSIEKVNQALSSSQAQLLNTPLLKTSFGGELYRIDKANAATLLASLRQKAQNKAIIVDFWATWCGPCIEQMPVLKKLGTETQDLPVQFVFICTSRGATMDEWSNRIKASELPGIHIFLEDTVNAELMGLFSFSTFPNYAFVDKTGHFISGTFSDKLNLKAEKIRELVKE